MICIRVKKGVRTTTRPAAPGDRYGPSCATRRSSCQSSSRARTGQGSAGVHASGSVSHVSEHAHATQSRAGAGGVAPVMCRRPGLCT
jgi:hypothetical protein